MMLETETCGGRGKCACEGNTLERLVRPALLIVLAKGELHGYAVVQQLAEMSMFEGQTPNASGVYRALNAMSSEGLVESSWELSASGPAKKSYKITPAGCRCLSMWMDTLARYRSSLDHLLNAGNQALNELRDSPVMLR